MTKADTYQVLAILQAFYPDSFRGMTEQAAQMKVGLWQDMFSDEPVELVAAAVKAYVASDKKGFMPVPGQIKETMQAVLDQDKLTETEAWDIVMKALGNSTYGSQEEFAKLPRNIQRAVGSANMLKDWASVNISELQTVIAATFKRDYRAIVAQAETLAKLPGAVKNTMIEAPKSAT